MAANPSDRVTTQVSLDVTTIAEALELARGARRAGIDWLEAGTPLILGEGLHAVRALRQERSKKGYLVAHIEVGVPAGDKARRVELKMTKTDGTVVKEKFVFRRGRDKDRDGDKDR